ncbi:hypothetical protein SDC9_130721 [bioreactor metagenome]|uniref:Uncharacterized protein n=1 Tax=bioreactor metagenome TaxID=1076179 RepID=A0A645D4T9_9ZZZZ
MRLKPDGHAAAGVGDGVAVAAGEDVPRHLGEVHVVASALVEAEPVAGRLAGEVADERVRRDPRHGFVDLELVFGARQPTVEMVDGRHLAESGGDAPAHGIASGDVVQRDQRRVAVLRVPGQHPCVDERLAPPLGVSDAPSEEVVERVVRRPRHFVIRLHLLIRTPLVGLAHDERLHPRGVFREMSVEVEQQFRGAVLGEVVLVVAEPLVMRFEILRRDLLGEPRLAGQGEERGGGRNDQPFRRGVRLRVGEVELGVGAVLLRERERRRVGRIDSEVERPDRGLRVNVGLGQRRRGSGDPQGAGEFRGALGVFEGVLPVGEADVILLAGAPRPVGFMAVGLNPRGHAAVPALSPPPHVQPPFRFGEDVGNPVSALRQVELAVGEVLREPQIRLDEIADAEEVVRPAVEVRRVVPAAPEVAEQPSGGVVRDH